MKIIYKMVILFALMSLMWVNTGEMMALNSEKDSTYNPKVEEAYSSFVYIFWEPEDFNDVIEDSNEQLKDFLDNTYEYYKNNFEDYEDFEELDLTKIDFSENVDLGEKIKNGLGYNIGINLNEFIHPLIDFDIYPGVKFENYFVRSESTGDIEAEGNIRNGDEEINVDFDVEGIYENELDLEIRGLSLPVTIPAFDKIELSVGPLYYWGNAKNRYVIERSFDYTIVDDEIDEELDDIISDIPGKSHLEVQQDLNISSGLGWKIGLIYDYELQNNLSIYARGYHRSVEIDIEVSERKKDAEGSGEISEEVYEEFEDEFSEDIGGMEISAGVSIKY